MQDLERAVDLEGARRRTGRPGRGRRAPPSPRRARGSLRRVISVERKLATRARRARSHAASAASPTAARADGRPDSERSRSGSAGAIAGAPGRRRPRPDGGPHSCSPRGGGRGRRHAWTSDGRRTSLPFQRRAVSARTGGRAPPARPSSSPSYWTRHEGPPPPPKGAARPDELWPVRRRALLRQLVTKVRRAPAQGAPLGLVYWRGGSAADPHDARHGRRRVRRGFSCDGRADACTRVVALVRPPVASSSSSPCRRGAAPTYKSLRPGHAAGVPDQPRRAHVAQTPGQRGAAATGRAPPP